jgi:hypothetical protein
MAVPAGGSLVFHAPQIPRLQSDLRRRTKMIQHQVPATTPIYRILCITGAEVLPARQSTSEAGLSLAHPDRIFRTTGRARTAARKHMTKPTQTFATNETCQNNLGVYSHDLARGHET